MSNAKILYLAFIMAATAIILTGCHAHGVRNTYVQSRPTHVHRDVYVVPPHAPAHGYRHRYHDHDLVYDANIGAYVVVGYINYYFIDGVYYRYTDNRWYYSPAINRGWQVYRKDRLPGKLYRKHRYSKDRHDHDYRDRRDHDYKDRHDHDYRDRRGYNHQEVERDRERERRREHPTQREYSPQREQQHPGDRERRDLEKYGVQSAKELQLQKRQERMDHPGQEKMRVSHPDQGSHPNQRRVDDLEQGRQGYRGNGGGIKKSVESKQEPHDKGGSNNFQNGKQKSQGNGVAKKPAEYKQNHHDGGGSKPADKGKPADKKKEKFIEESNENSGKRPNKF